MKKLLSLLVTLALATSAFAECAFYMDDFVVNRDQIGNGTEITLPIKATFSGRLNGWDLEITYPEHMIPTYIEEGADMTLTYYNARGKQQTLNASISGAYAPWDHVLCAIMAEGYYQDPEGEDPTAWVTYNAVKWEAGVYEEMLLLSFEIEEGFEGGEILFRTQCASGKDPRGGTILENGDHKVWFERTIKADLQPITEAPEITYTMDEDEAIITATGKGEVLLYVNGEPVSNPYTIARGEEDVEYTITATAQGEGEIISEPAELKLLVPAKPEAVYGVGLKKMWSNNNSDVLPSDIPVNDMRQGFGMNGKFYVNSKCNVLDSATMTYTTVPTVYVFDETGRVEKTYPGGKNCGITRDEAGNLVISDAQFPNAWTEATIKVINPETDVTKVYTVPAECGIEGRCDFIGFAQGDLMNDGVLYLVGSTTNGVAVMTIAGGEVNTDECYTAPCDGLSPTTNTIVNYFKDLEGEDAMLYVTRNAAPVKMKFDGSELTGTAFSLPNKGACNGVFPFVWNDQELFLYPTLPNYLDGFAIAEAGAAAPLYVQEPTKSANPNGIQCNWLNAEVDDNGVTVYQYVPGAGGYFAIYRIAEFERTQTPEITYEITDEAVIVTATGSGTVKMYVDGVLVENPYTIARGEEDVTVTVTATAHKDGKIISETAEEQIVIPALPKTATPVITFETNDDAVIITATGDGEVLLYVNGEPVENPYTMTRGDEDVTITVTATAQEEGKLVSDPAEQTLVIPAYVPKTDMPVITFETTDDAVIITATGEGEVLLYINGELVENPYTMARGDEDVTITVTATAQEEGKRISDPAEQTLVIPAYVPQTDMPVITFETTDDAVIITATGEGEVLLYVNGELVENPYTMARGEEDVTITVTATAQEEGKRISDVATATLVIPAYQVTADPVITIEVTDSTVIITATGDGDVQLYVNGEPVDNPYTIERGDEDVVITVTATAKEEGKLMSTVTQEVTIPMIEGGSVDELLGSKTVANVRYFNMAGQEMKEANGATIIVTTYTDGSHSAVKVIK